MSQKRNKVEIFFIFALLTISIFLPPFNARVLASQEGEIIWVQTSNPSADPSFLSDRALDVAVDVSGLYVVGYDNSPGAPQWRIEKRAPSDGALIWSKTNNPGNGDAVAYGITVDDSGLYIAGYDSSPGDLQWRIEKRIKITSVGGIGTLINITHGDEWFQHRILLYMILAVVSLLFFMPFARRLVK